MTALEAASPRGRALGFAAALVGVLILCGLGGWQVERLAWKEALIARIDARTHAPPAPPPPPGEWASLNLADLEYTHVSARGRYAPDKEALVFRAGKTAPDAAIEPGFWVMTPLMLSGGASVLVNRGFIAADAKDRPHPPPVGQVVVTGLLRAPEEHGAFTPADAPDKGQWFTRDPKAIAAAMGLAQAAPFSIDADAAPAPPGQPGGGATMIDIPNNHLSYALTWFGLAAALAAMTLVSALRRRASDQGVARFDTSATAATTRTAPANDSGSSVSPNQT